MEISIAREKGTDVVPVRVFGEIARKLINIANNDENVIFYYFCDATEAIPSRRPGKTVLCQDYRNELFKLLFQRYYSEAKENWFDNEICLKFDGACYYVHFLTREQHCNVIELLKDEVINDFEEIVGAK